MPRLYFPQDPQQKAALVRWAMALIPVTANSNVAVDPAYAEPIAIVSDDGARLFGVTVYHNLIKDYGLLEVSFATKGHPAYWCRPEIMAALFHYPFQQARARKLLATVAADNDKSNRFLKGLGFTKEATLRHHFADRHHAYLWSMTDREYRKSRWFRDVEMKEAA